MELINSFHEAALLHRLLKGDNYLISSLEEASSHQFLYIDYVDYLRQY